MNNKLLVLALAVLSSSCATSSGVMPFGPDTYTISTSDEFSGVVNAKKKAIKEANAYCTKMGKQMMPTNTSSGSYDDSFELIFQCLDKGDPGLRRPDMRKAPDVVIEKR